MGSSSPPHRTANLGDFVHRFAWACLLRPAGVKMALKDEETVVSSEEEEEHMDSGKVSKSKTKSKSSSFKEESFHEPEWEPDRSDKALSSHVHALETTISDIFDTVSALKSAYIQLQSAHSPFDPDKLRLADKAVILELRRLSEIKHSFRRSHPTSEVEQENEDLRWRLHELQSACRAKERAIEGYKARLHACEQETAQLKASLEQVTARKDKMERRLRRYAAAASHRQGTEQIVHGVKSDRQGYEEEPSPRLLEMAVENAREAALGFSKLLVSMMKGVNWDLEAAAESIEAGIKYARPAHRRFAFESYVCQRMFCGFENENFYINGSLSSILDPVKHRGECFLQFRDMRAVDPADLLGITPECLFGKFCHRKFLQIVHEKMEESFFSGFEQHREVILAGGHPRTRFYGSFLRFAKAVWLVHLLAFSFHPTAGIFQVKRGTEFDPAFMDSAAKNVRMSDEDEEVRPRVGFTVTPGFRVDKWIIKCQVYLDGSNSSRLEKSQES